MHPSSTQRARLDVIMRLAEVDFERATEALNKMNRNIVEYELRDVNDDDVAKISFHGLISSNSEAKMVKWLDFELVNDNSSIYVICQSKSTIWIYPDTDLMLPDTTIKAQ